MLGLGKRLRGVEYHRIVEYSRAYLALGLSAESRLLDLGTGKHSIFPLFCSYGTGCCCYITDIGDCYLHRQLAYVSRVPRLRQSLAAGDIVIESRDATALSYPDGTFSAVTTISSIEHIPDGGDTAAVREAYRVLGPGGTFVATLPMSEGRPAFDVYHRRRVFARAYEGEPVFRTHRYDPDTIRSRILEAAPFGSHRVEYWHDDGFYRDRWGRMKCRNQLKYVIGWWLTQAGLRHHRQLGASQALDASLAVVVLRK